MEILQAFDLTGSLRDAARLAGCPPTMVARYVRLRAMGRLPTGRSARREQLVDPFLAKVEEWVERSHGRVRADVVHDKLRALGFGGSERTTRRAVAQAKRAYAAGHRRVFRPWIPEPGMWLQFDWGKGPRIGGRDTLLWCAWLAWLAWLAWPRFRVVIPTWDRTMPTVIASLDETLRRFGGSPTYALTDNERTVTIDRVAGIAVKHPGPRRDGSPLRAPGPRLRARRPGLGRRVGRDAGVQFADLAAFGPSWDLEGFTSWFALVFDAAGPALAGLMNGSTSSLASSARRERPASA